MNFAVQTIAFAMMLFSMSTCIFLSRSIREMLFFVLLLLVNVVVFVVLVVQEVS